MATPGTKVVALASTMLVLVAGTPATAGPANRTLRMVLLDGGGLQGVARDINARGQVLGYLQDRGPTRPTMWNRNGSRVDIAVPGGYPYAFNDRGDVILGGSLLTTDPVLWSQGRVVPLTDPPYRVWPADLNNRRQVVGSRNLDSPASEGAFRWQDGQFTHLRPPAGMGARAIAVNERGDVLGHLLEPGLGPHVDIFLWRNGVMTRLGLPEQDGSVRDMNDRGQVIGNRHGGSATHPFLWHQGRMIDLMAGRPRSQGGATDINNAGDVVGLMDSRPVRWRQGRAPVLIGPASWTGVAEAVNERGDIAGVFGFVRDEEHTDNRVFLWRDGRLLLSKPVIAPLQASLVGVDEEGRIAGTLIHSETGESHPVVWTIR